MATEYKSIEYRLHENLVQMQDMLSLLEFDDSLLKAVIDCKELIRTKKYTIAVMGEFKRGKSSLINALLGGKILPADSTPTTATINRITYGSAPKSVVYYKDGSDQEIDIHELSNFVTQTTEDGKARALRIKEAIVYYPTVICQNHIDVIDTPGLNDDERMTQITIDMLEHVDAVIVPIHARSPFSETEKKFVCQLIKNKNINNVVFVVTFMDQLDEDDYEYDQFIGRIKKRIQSGVFEELEKQYKNDDSIISKAHLLLDDLHICGISASLALSSFLTNNREMLKQSRFEEFQKFLLMNVTSKQLENAARRTIETLKHVVSQLDGQNRKKILEYNKEAKLVNSSSEAIQKYCREVRLLLDKSFFEDYDRLNATVVKLNVLKNQIMKEFIKALSELKTNSNDAIKGTLNATAEKALQMIRENKAKTDADLFQCFFSEVNKLNAFRQTGLIEPLHYLEVSDRVNVQNTTWKMLEFVHTIFANVIFSWKVSPIPAISDLTNCNIIEPVIHSVDVSVTQYINDYQACLNAIRKNWFNQLAEETEAIKNLALEAEKKKSELIDLKMKVHIKNYQVLSENSVLILSNSEEIWKQ